MQEQIFVHGYFGRNKGILTGFVIFSTFSEIFIFEIILLSFSIATSLYTPPKTGEDLETIIFSPTPNESI